MAVRAVQALCLVHQWTQACSKRSRRIGSLDLPVLATLAGHQLAVGVNEAAVCRRGLARALHAVHQILEDGERGRVLGWVVDTFPVTPRPKSSWIVCFRPSRVARW
jgi:hypothetical protein